MDNKEVLQHILNSLFEVTSKKTSPGIAELIVGAILKQLQQKFNFLSTIHFDMNSSQIEIPSSVNSIDGKKIGKAIEAIIRLIYMNLDKQAGVDFINELERFTDSDVLVRMKALGVDLDLMRIEHHQFFKGRITETQNVSQHDSNNEQHKSTSSTDENSNELIPHSDEIKLLQILQKKDVNSDEVIDTLQISLKELENMVISLLNKDFLCYISDDELKLTNKAITFLINKNLIA